jgi:hypothetical protein
LTRYRRTAFGWKKLFQKQLVDFKMPDHTLQAWALHLAEKGCNPELLPLLKEVDKDDPPFLLAHRRLIMAHFAGDSVLWVFISDLGISSGMVSLHVVMYYC